MKKKFFIKKQDDSNLNFFKTLLTSLLIILIFSVLPNTVSFIKNNLKSNEVVLNSSKQNFDEILENQNKKKKSSKIQLMTDFHGIFLRILMFLEKMKMKRILKD